jgi:hypothetical protein
MHTIYVSMQYCIFTVHHIFQHGIFEENCIVSSFIISSLSNTVILIQARRICCVGHVTCLVEVSNV